MSGSSETPRGWEAGGAGTTNPKRKPRQKPVQRKEAPRKKRAKVPSTNKIIRKAGDRLLLGWRREDARQQVGFREGGAPAAAADHPLWLQGEGHTITIAPTGTGKGRGALIPNLLTYEGPAIVIDPKGEACRVTARRRREMGQKVHIIDPFGLITRETDSLNPMDAFAIPGVDASALALDIAKQLSGGGKIGKDPFWDIRGHDLAAGAIAAIAAIREARDCNLIEVRRLLKRDDVVFNMHNLLEGFGNKMPSFAADEISSFLGTTDVTRSGILATACSYFSVIASDVAQRTVVRSTIDLAAVRRGDPMTIYLVVPPTKLASHASLFRLWTAALMSAVLSREGNLPKYRTLFAIDECAQLGDFGQLSVVYTLARSYGVRVWTFFQDLAQIQKMLPDEWPTVLTNTAALQVFGVPNYLAGSALANVLGDFSEQELRRMDRRLFALQVAGRLGLTARRLDYLKDPAFQGLFDRHPMLGRRSLDEPDGPLSGL